MLPPTVLSTPPLPQVNPWSADSDDSEDEREAFDAAARRRSSAGRRWGGCTEAM